MLKLLLSAGLTITLIWILDHPLTFEDTQVPALGHFFSPAQGFWHNAESGESGDMILQLPELDKEVNIVFDDRLVPHIFASGIEDLYYAQGYVTAMHRLWQMDISIRAAAGRISEILGPRSLAFDRRQRQIGMTYAAENAYESWKNFPEYMHLLQRYADGVNAYIASLKPADYPVEFKLIGYAPEPWSIYKSALFYKNMALTLCSSNYDLEYTQLLNWLGQESFAFLFPEYNPDQDPIIPPGTLWEFNPIETKVNDSLHLPVIPSQGRRAKADHDDQSGSNNWAVSGLKTASGQPILCNDPHLGLTMPSIWYEMHLNTPDYNAYGVSFAGFPAVIIGFNDSIAWGMTNAGHDVTDWYKIRWANDARSMYIIDGKAHKVEYRTEEIAVRDSDSIVDTVKYTIWGPVMEDGLYGGLARRWIAHDTSRSREPGIFIELNQASNIEEFRDAIALFQCPAQNFVYADQLGNIGMQLGGQLPLRRPDQGKFVQDGSTKENAWQGFIPFDHNPASFNPGRGFVSSANQRTTDNTYPYHYLGGRQFEDYRGRLLNQRLATMENITVAKMQELQYDNESLKAREILPALLKAVEEYALKPAEQQAFSILQQWDYTYRTDGIAPVYFEEWYSQFYDLVWDEFTVIEDSTAIVRPEAWRTIDLAVNAPASEYFDLAITPDSVETFGMVALMSFSSAVETVTGRDTISWGTYRTTTIRHLANLPGMNVRLENTSGHGDALNATTRSHGPSWRMVVHLTDPVEAFVVYPGGQSGNPGSPYYDNMIDDWVSGQYHQVQFFADAEDIDSHLNILLQPEAQ